MARNSFQLEIRISETSKNMLARRYKQIQSKIMEGARQAVVREARLIRDKSKRLVPVETGKLRDSFFSRKGRVDNEMYEQIIGYSADYAQKQHENLAYKHEQGQAKYLSQPVDEQAETAPQRWAARIAKVANLEKL
tara:strand:- start:6273 stop:6680 length:408 start_codon:yes stop_codon:yes gene_type:complete